MSVAPGSAPPTSPAWLQAGFRPFFLLVGVYGAVAAAGWVAVLRGVIPPPPGLPVTWWHAHEMLFGLVAAAAAGFLLTSVPVWTGSQRVRGARLAGLVAVWVAGRAVMWLGAWLPPAAMVVELAFLPLVAAAIAPPIWRAGTRRNYGFPVVLLALFAGDLAVHASALGAGGLAAPEALRFAVHLVTALIVVVGGRITPLFTNNALRRAGTPAPVLDRPVAGQAAVASVVLLAVSHLLPVPAAARGVLALAASAALAVRMLGWQTRRTLGDALLVSLHAGYAWLAVGLLLSGLAQLGAPVDATSGLHALTAGAMGGMILAVALRVPLGHTGRPFVALPGSVAILVAVHAGALLRVVYPYVPPGLAGAVIAAAGLLWGAAFLGYAVRYGPMLLSPRADGQPG